MILVGGEGRPCWDRCCRSRCWAGRRCGETVDRRDPLGSADWCPVEGSARQIQGHPTRVGSGLAGGAVLVAVVVVSALLIFVGEVHTREAVDVGAVTGAWLQSTVAVWVTAGPVRRDRGRSGRYSIAPFGRGNRVLWARRRDRAGAQCKERHPHRCAPRAGRSPGTVREGRSRHLPPGAAGCRAAHPRTAPFGRDRDRVKNFQGP